MTMIEKVARAIAAQRWHHVPGYIDRYWHTYIPYAKSAIEAMKEPTEEMKDAVGNDSFKVDGYEDMIEAALKQ